MTEIITPSDLERAALPDGDIYDRFIVPEGYGILMPFRENIVSEYTEDYFGYLIQQNANGFRWIMVELGETDEFGPYCLTRKGALQDAVGNWRNFGQGDSWAQWSNAMAADSEAPERVGAAAIEAILTAKLGADENYSAAWISLLATELAAELNR